MAQAQLVFKRREIKYVITSEQRARLESVMARHMVPDAYGPSTICNLYYDTPTLLLARRSAEHPVYKEKIRERSYGTPGLHTPVYVELKKKYKGIVYKRRCAFQPRQANAFLAGRVRPKTQIQHELLCAVERYEDLAPTCYLAYDRRGYYAPDNHEFRMTFDENVRARWDDLDLSRGDHGERILEPELSILEVKSLDAMPLWLVDHLDEEHIYKTSYSKYGTACSLHTGELLVAS